MNGLSGTDIVASLTIIFSIMPIVITCIWFFGTRKKGYSWRETWEIEMHNSRRSSTESALYIAGYDLSDIERALPKRIRYQRVKSSAR